MEKTSIKLQPFDPKDLSYLFDKTSEIKFVLLNEPVSFSDYAEFSEYFFHRLDRFFHDFYIVEDETGPFGFVFTYDYRVYDGNCRLFLYSEHHQSELLTKILNKLFDEYPLKKIFCWIRQDDIEMQKAIEMIASSPEAVLQEYYFADGKYLDVFVYGFSRGSIIHE